VGAVLSLAAAFVCGNAQAASFSIVGGSSSNLPSSFNPSPNVDGLAPGLSVSVFSTLNQGTGGLYVDPGNSSLLFTYYGLEANHTNVAEATFTYNAGSPMFSTAANNPGDSQIVANGGSSGLSLVNFLFADQTAFPDRVAVNGGNIGALVLLAFYVTPDGQTAYAFFDDTGKFTFLPDFDGDDMIVKISFAGGGANPPEMPIPGALWLFGSVLAGGAALARRRKQRKTVLA